MLPAICIAGAVSHHSNADGKPRVVSRQHMESGSRRWAQRLAGLSSDAGMPNAG